MANDSIIDSSFTEAINDLNKLYDENKLKTLIENARELLQDAAMPRYHRMRTLLLLGSVAKDWSEPNACREEVDFLWRITRRWHPMGENSDVDAALDELCGELDERTKALAGEEPEDYDAETAVVERVALHDKAVEEERELLGGVGGARRTASTGSEPCLPFCSSAVAGGAARC